MWIISKMRKRVDRISEDANARLKEAKRVREETDIAIARSITISKHSQELSDKNRIGTAIAITFAPQHSDRKG